MTPDDAIGVLEPHVANLSARLDELERCKAMATPDMLRELEQGIDLIHGVSGALFGSLGAIDEQLVSIVERLRRLQGS